MKAKQISKKKGASKATVTKGARKRGTRKKGTRKSKPTTPVGDIMRTAAEVIRSAARNIRP